MTHLVALWACLSLLVTANVYADYKLGCDDPEYHQFVKQRFAYFEAKNMRLYDQTLADYKRSLTGSSNPYQVLGDLSRHLKYSAQIDPISDVSAKINRMFAHGDALSVSQQIAGNVLDGFSSEAHAVDIARAWVAYRQGKHEAAFNALLMSIETSESAVLHSFGPDFELVRRMYQDGHTEPVIAYINKTREFWTGKRADKLRDVWLKMINAGCQILFDSVDTITAIQLGLDVHGENIINRR